MSVQSVLELAGQSHAQHRQRLGADVLAQLEELEESQSVALVVVGKVAVVEGVLPSVSIQRSILHASDGVFPLVACVERGSLHDAATGKAEHARVHVGQRLSQVVAQTVLAALVGVFREERHMLQRHGVLAAQEDAQLSLRFGSCGLDHHLVAFPLRSLHVYFHLAEVLSFIHGLLVDELHANLRAALRSPGPHREAIVLVFLDADAEEALVLQSRSPFLVSRVAQHHVVRTAFKESVVLQFHVAKDPPAHEVLRKLKRAVLHQFAIQAAVGGKVNVLEEQSVHGRRHGSPCLLCLHVHHVRLCLSRQGSSQCQSTRK